MPQPPPKPLPLDPENPCVLVSLHQYPEFTFQCATLLNLEWPRSRQARLNALWSCSRSFPVALVLVQSDRREAVGFCKISLIPSLKHACFVESVVVHPEMRGKGLGSFLMTKVEDYVLSRKLNILYLSTLGQEKFYKKLGYNECDPVSLYAFGINSNSTSEQSSNNVENLKNDVCKTGVHQNHFGGTIEKSGSAFAPPPPPLPKSPLGQSVMTVKTYMKKELRKVFKPESI